MKNPTILIADDYEVDRILLREFLNNRGFPVILATNGSDAVEQALARKPDLILLDIKMNDMDGFEACKRIKAKNPETIIIFVTSDESLETKRKAYSVGGQDIIYKPYDGPVLLDIIKNNSYIKNNITKKSKTICQLQEKETLYQEELEKSSYLKEVGLLSTSVAHDINNYLAGILGNLEIIEMYSQDNKDVLEACGEITKSIEDTSNLAAMLTSFSKENSSLERKKVNLIEIMQSAINLLAKDSRYKFKIKLNIECENTLNISAVRVHISTIFINFLKNSCEALENNGLINVSIKKGFPDNPKLIEGHLKSGEYAIVSIKDNGCGIPEDKISELLKPFQSTKSFGTGIGMHSAVKYIKQYKGALNIQSKVGKGTEITVYFPLISRLNLASHTQVLHKITTDLSGLKILLVDDEKVLCRSISKFLEKHGAAVVAFDGEFIPEQIKDAVEDKDLFIIDYNIPFLNTAELILCAEAANENLQIILISGGPISTELGQKYNTLQKPFAFQQLIQIIEK